MLQFCMVFSIVYVQYGFPIIIICVAVAMKLYKESNVSMRSVDHLETIRVSNAYVRMSNAIGIIV